MITRQRWAAGTDTTEMLRSALAWAKNPERKRRLYRVALVRRVWDELPWLSRVLTELAEREADGRFDPAALSRSLDYLAEELWIRARLWRDGSTQQFESELGHDASEFEKLGYARSPGDPFQPTDPERLCELLELAYCVHSELWPDRVCRKHDSAPLLRDVFGNPFRRITFRPAWRTDTAVLLARQMYESRDFSALPVLADALQDAGCDSEDVLKHCREPGEHVRGCWVVDLVLGTE